jgi:hypothetical protein
MFPPSRDPMRPRWRRSDKPHGGDGGSVSLRERRSDAQREI